jgi:hypothetical protein
MKAVYHKGRGVLLIKMRGDPIETEMGLGGGAVRSLKIWFWMCGGNNDPGGGTPAKGFLLFNITPRGTSPGL